MFALRKFAFLLAALVATSATASAAPITIDNFMTAGNANVTLGGTAPPSVSFSSPSQSGAGILGNRVITSTIDSGVAANSLTSAIAGGNYAISNGAINVKSILTYTGFGPLNLTGSPSVTLNVSQFLATNGPTVQLAIQDTTLGTFVDVGSPILITGTGPLSISLGASDRDATTGVRLTFVLLGGDDITLNNVNGPQFADTPGVPEPMTLATFGFLTLCGGVAARRKLKAASVAKA